MKHTDQSPESFHVPAGDYDVTIVDAAETVSRYSGADMIELTLEVDTADGYPIKFFDYLVASPSSAWRIDAFRRALRQNVVKGERVELVGDDFLGLTLRARLKVVEFHSQLHNRVEAWLAPRATAIVAPARIRSVIQKERSQHESF